MNKNLLGSKLVLHPWSYFHCTACFIQLQAVNWRLNLQMAQGNMTKMKLPNAMFELSLASGSQVKGIAFSDHKRQML